MAKRRIMEERTATLVRLPPRLVYDLRRLALDRKTAMNDEFIAAVEEYLARERARQTGERGQP